MDRFIAVPCLSSYRMSNKNVTCTLSLRDRSQMGSYSCANNHKQDEDKSISGNLCTRFENAKGPTALRGSHFLVCVCLSVTRVLTCESRKAHQDKRANYQCPVLLAPELQTWDAPAAPTAWTCDPQVQRHVSV